MTSECDNCGMSDGCSLALFDCERDADFEVTLKSSVDSFDPMVRQCCTRHLGWYRRQFVKEREYEMDVEVLTERGAEHWSRINA